MLLKTSFQPTFHFRTNHHTDDSKPQAQRAETQSTIATQSPFLTSSKLDSFVDLKVKPSQAERHSVYPPRGREHKISPRGDLEGTLSAVSALCVQNS